MKEYSNEKYVKENIKFKKEPPRDYSFYEAIKYAYSVQNSKPLLFFGIGFSIAIIYFWFSGKVTQGSGSLILSIMLIAGALSISCIPIFLANRIYVAINRGYLGVAEILDFMKEELKGFTAYPTARYGAIKGRWKIVSSLGSFEQAFISEAPWADDVKKGDKLNVVLHPKKKIVLFVIDIIT